LKWHPCYAEDFDVGLLVGDQESEATGMVVTMLRKYN
jgi:hypothetical protein